MFVCGKCTKQAYISEINCDMEQLNCKIFEFKL